jgi:hypothetical protein
MAEQMNEKEIEFSDLSSVDDVGRVFFRGERVFRAIRHEAVERVRELFSCGLVEELVENGIFPASWITDYTLEGYGLVVEHARCFPVTYPYEWSFSMLRDAAVAVLKTNLLARKYGYQTQDCHGFNIVFDGVRPKFVDLGSFVRVLDEFKGWLAHEEFLRFYYYPLKIWKDGNGYIARMMLLGYMSMPHSSYLLYRYPLCRMVDPSRLENAARLFCKLKTFTGMPSEAKADGFIMNLARRLAVLNRLPFMKVDLHAWMGKIERLSLKSYETMWGGYHRELYRDGNILPTPRFNTIVEIVKGLGPASLLELAGNQGILSMMLAAELPGVSLTCTDYDEIAVDAMYLKAKERGITVSPALLDFVYPTLTSHGKHPCDRFRAEAVLALAVTHHLLLTGRMPIDTVFRSISSFSRKYVLVEFMPLGLHDGVSAPPLPAWYNVDWFRNNFRAEFDLLREEVLEENRILFVGKLKGSAGQ